MSTLRLSVLKQSINATTGGGDINLDPYSRRRRLGRMDTLPEGVLAKPNSALSHYFDSMLEAAVADLPEDAPATVMMYGFFFRSQKKGFFRPQRYR